MSDTKTTDELITLLKQGEYDGTVIMQVWCRLRQLTEENARLREAHLRTANELVRIYGGQGHHCDWRVAAEGMIQRSKQALQEQSNERV